MEVNFTRCKFEVKRIFSNISYSDALLDLLWKLTERNTYVIIVSVIYMRKCVDICVPGQERLMVIVCVLIAQKMLHDDACDASTFARYMNINVFHIASMERKVFRYLGYNAIVRMSDVLELCSFDENDVLNVENVVIEKRVLKSTYLTLPKAEEENVSASTVSISETSVTEKLIVETIFLGTLTGFCFYLFSC
jgi:hypothetical protein